MMHVKTKIDLVIFDSDDTLIDTKKRDYFTFIHLIRKYENFNFNSLEYDEFITKRREGKTAMELIDAIIPENLMNRSELLITCIKERNSIFEKDEYLLYDKIFEGVGQILQLLRKNRIKIGIASLRKNSKGFKETLERLNLSQLVDVFCCSGDIESEDYKIYNLGNIRSIDHPTSLHHICTKICLYKKIIASMNCEPSKAVVIGDRITDLIAAKAIGAVSIGVQSGYTSGEKLRKDGMAFAVIKNVTYLPLVLQKISNVRNNEV